MANKRMFSMDVVDTDKFLDMSASTQCLYFHLGMRADDDGFVSSPKKMLMYGKEASNRKQEIDRQHHTIPNQRNQRPKDKHRGNVYNLLFRHGKVRSQNMEKLKGSFPTFCKQTFPQFHKIASYAHYAQCRLQLNPSHSNHFSGKRFEDNFPDFIKKYGFKDMYSAGFYPYKTLEEHWAYWSRYVFINRYENAPKSVYNDLYNLIRDKDYFVLTTNVDHCFQKAGGYGNVQNLVTIKLMIMKPLLKKWLPNRKICLFRPN